ncbi:hypothetical protein NQ314_002800, partial [Rhamnusium bicolor]
LLDASLSKIYNLSKRYKHNTTYSKLLKIYEKLFIAGFCVKTKELGNETKVFINICKTESIPPPKDITESELLEIIESDLPEGYKVPMSIGEIRPEKDKKGEEAKACDIAIHPNFLKKVEEIQAFKNFFMAIVFQGLEHKYGLVCEDEKIILRNRKAFGTLQMHRIQQREIDQKMGRSGETSLLQDITGTDEENKRKVVIETLSSNENATREPEYRMYKRKDGQNCLIAEFKLPDIISAKEVTLDVGEDRILLESKSKGYFLDIFIPYIVKQKNCTSSFQKSTKILTVTMPLVGG